MNSYSGDSNEAMKRGSEVLNTSLLQFLRSIKRCFPSMLRFYSALKVSSPLLFQKNHCLTFIAVYFLKEIHRLKLHRRIL